MHARAIIVLTIPLALAAFARAQSVSFTPLGDLPSGTFASKAMALAGDGRSIAGNGNDGSDVAALWRFGSSWGAPQALTRLSAGATSIARASANGGAIAFGEANNAAGFRQAVRWQGTAVALLGSPPAGGYSGVVYACSHDGAVACGENLYQPPGGGGPPPLPITQAFRWTIAGMVDLGTLPGTSATPGGTTTARAMSSDGSVIVGWGLDSGFTYRPWRWTPAGGMVDISAAQWSGFARGCSPDGNVVVGSRSLSGTSEAFAWTPSGGRRDLGVIGAYSYSAAVDASTGGRRICGIMQIIGVSNSQKACIWDAGVGWRIVEQVLSGAGANVTGWNLSFALSMSDDGATIAGYGTDPAGQTQAWTAVIPLPCAADFDDGSGTGTPDGGVTIDDLLFYLSLFSTGDPRGDVDDGSGSGTPDSGVTIDDLLYFLARFASGC